MGKKPTNEEIVHMQSVEELRATVAFLTSARSVLIGERDKFVAQIKDQSVLIQDMDKVVKKLRNETQEIREHLKTKREDLGEAVKGHTKTYERLRKEEDAVDRRNLVIFFLSVPYLIAVVSFLCNHLSVSLH